MNARLSPEEAREQRMTDLTRECADTIKQALVAGLPKTTVLIDEALGDYMQDDHARAELLRRTAAGEHAFAKVLDDLIWHEAEKRAEQELEREALDRREESMSERAMRWLWAHGVLA